MKIRITSKVIATASVLAFVALACDARAATFTVNSTADTTDGSCGAAVGECTLREAIEAAVATAGRDTIAFDPSVFPHETSLGFITLASPLPIIADAAGTVVDGSGAGVKIFDGPNVQGGLVFASAAGVPLAKVTVANVILGFAGTQVDVCGGVPPDCLDDVSDVLVRNVAVGGGGIVIEGGVVSKVRVVDSVTVRTDGCGIRVFGKTSLDGVRVEGSSAIGSDSCGGILLDAAEDVVGTTVADSLSVRSDGTGIAIAGRDVSKTKLTNVVASDNDGFGIQVRADNDTAGTTVANAVASTSGVSGVDVTAGGRNSALTFTNVTAGSASSGIAVTGPTAGLRITGATVAENFIGVDLFDTGTGVTGGKLADIVIAANEKGMFLHGDATVLQKIHVSSNAAAGITLSGGDGGNTITKSTVHANDTQGISLINSSSNVIQKNVALGNGLDLSDNSPDCDANSWTRNVFRTGSQPCIR